ncbi:hypothetical protein ACX9NE_09825 [Mycobacterium sp. ML4]
MTTHDQRSDLTGSYEQSHPAAQSTPPAEEHTQPQRQTAGGEAAPRSEASPSMQQSPGVGQSATEETLFAEAELADLRARWAGVQAAFVDDPKDCVQKADVLVSDLVDQLTTVFARARSRLEEQWSRGEEASTEDLRMALMQYREFFERLLAV